MPEKDAFDNQFVAPPPGVLRFVIKYLPIGAYYSILLFVSGLSDQLRLAMEQASVSHYALAKQVGVPPSVLTRFMAGERGLSLATVDKLAEVLGLELVQTLSRVGRPQRRGRPGRRKEMELNRENVDWNRAASCLAKDAYENHFTSRRGLWYFGDLNVTCLYNNNPWEGDPGRRETETREFRRLIDAEGIEELAYEVYPEEGESAGYSYAMILDVDQERWGFLQDAVKKGLAMGEMLHPTQPVGDRKERYDRIIAQAREEMERLHLGHN